MSALPPPRLSGNPEADAQTLLSYVNQIYKTVYLSERLPERVAALEAANADLVARVGALETTIAALKAIATLTITISGTYQATEIAQIRDRLNDLILAADQ